MPKVDKVYEVGDLIKFGGIDDGDPAEHGLMTVLKPFSQRLSVEAYRAAKSKDHQYPEDFVQWLVDEGYLSYDLQQPHDFWDLGLPGKLDPAFQTGKLK